MSFFSYLIFIYLFYCHSNGDKRNGAKPYDNEFDGNFWAALKSHLNQNPPVIQTAESEPGQFGATRDLYVYIAENAGNNV